MKWFKQYKNYRLRKWAIKQASKFRCDDNVEMIIYAKAIYEYIKTT